MVGLQAQTCPSRRCAGGLHFASRLQSTRGQQNTSSQPTLYITGLECHRGAGTRDGSQAGLHCNMAGSGQDGWKVQRLLEGAQSDLRRVSAALQATKSCKAAVDDALHARQRQASDARTLTRQMRELVRSSVSLETASQSQPAADRACSPQISQIDSFYDRAAAESHSRSRTAMLSAQAAQGTPASQQLSSPARQGEAWTGGSTRSPATTPTRPQSSASAAGAGWDASSSPFRPPAWSVRGGEAKPAPAPSPPASAAERASQIESLISRLQSSTAELSRVSSL